MAAQWAGDFVRPVVAELILARVSVEMILPFSEALNSHGGQIERIDFPNDDHFGLPQPEAPQAWLPLCFGN